MENPLFFLIFLICAVFLFANLRKIGLENKSFIVPSTFFCGVWGLASLGLVAYTNDWVESADYYKRAAYLDQIGSYELKIIIVCCLAFILARVKNKNIRFETPTEDNMGNISTMLSFLRWVLYAYFAVGMFRLSLVLYVVGFDYQAIRELYVNSRAGFTIYEQNLNRIGSYLMQASVFYVCLFGVESALKGMSLKKVFINFLLFAPFQLSFGGRLFIISFFIPFLFSYAVIFSMNNFSKQRKRKEFSKLYIVAVVTVALVVFMQVLKMGDKVDSSSMKEQSHEIFYSTSMIYHLNELWSELPSSFPLGLGRNLLGNPSPVYVNIQEEWLMEQNSAAVAVPSMIPDMYLDYGEYLSLVVYFFLAFWLESGAMKLMSRFSFRNFMLYIFLCVTAFNTAGTAMSGLLKSTLVTFILIYILDKITNRRSKIINRYAPHPDL